MYVEELGLGACPCCYGGGLWEGMGFILHIFVADTELFLLHLEFDVQFMPGSLNVCCIFLSTYFLYDVTFAQICCMLCLIKGRRF